MYRSKSKITQGNKAVYSTFLIYDLFLCNVYVVESMYNLKYKKIQERGEKIKNNYNHLTKSITASLIHLKSSYLSNNYFKI